MNTMPFGKHKGTPLSELPIDYIWWLNGKDIKDHRPRARGEMSAFRIR